MIEARRPSRLLGFADQALLSMVGKNDPRLNLNPLPDLGGKMGGVLCIADLQGRPITTSFLGCVSEKERVNWSLACQAAEWLGGHPEVLSSSWESHGITNPGCAIRTDECILSFKGFTESWDEAFVLLVGIESDAIKSKDADKIAGISSNPHWLPLKESFGLGHKK